MAKPNNRFKLLATSGDFLNVFYEEDGEVVVEIVGFVETWEEAPASCKSGLRYVSIDNSWPVGIEDIQRRVLRHSGFGEIEAEYWQTISKEPFEQQDFNEYMRETDFVLSTSEFLKLGKDGQKVKTGRYFVIFSAGVLLLPQIQAVDREWAAHKAKLGAKHLPAGEALEWIDEFAKAHPEVDSPWNRDEMFSQISMIEEPSDPDPEEEGPEKGPDPAPVDPEHYNDGLVDVRVIQEFHVVAFVNADGKSTTVSYDDNFFSPKDLVEAYEKVFDDGWNEDKAARVAAFRAYLAAAGCSKEDLE